MKYRCWFLLNIGPHESDCNHKMTIRSLLFLEIVWLIASICTASEKSDKHLDDLFDEFWDWRSLDSPESRSRLGLHKHDDLLTSYNIHDFKSRKVKTEYFKDKLENIDFNTLSEHHQVEYIIYRDYLNTFLDGYRWREYQSLNPVNFIEGLQKNPKVFIKGSKFISRGDFENYIARLETLPKQLDEIKESMRRAVEVGHTFHNVSMVGVPQKIRSFLTGNLEEFILYEPLAETLENVSWISNPVKSDLRRRGRYACSEIVNSWRSLSDFIEYSYMRKTRATYGVLGWDNGKEFYKACLKFHLSMDMSPEEVHNIGLKEVSKTESQMQEIFKKLGHKGNIRQFVASLKNDSRFFRKTQEELLDIYRHITDERITPALLKAFHKIPDKPLRIEPLSYDGPTASYSSGKADGSRKAAFNVNLFRPSTHMIFTFMALALHEGNPGHHMQFTVTSGLDIPMYRRYLDFSNYYRPPFHFPFYTAYVEGWGLYAEVLGEEMGLYKDDYEMIGRYGAEMFRSCRLVVDTGIHYFNWSRERAVDYIVNYTALPRKQIEIEVDRYITWPGQACAYKIGEIKIKEIRQKAKETLGSKFNLKDFHDFYLNSGPMPLSVLEQSFDKWVEKVKSGKLDSPNDMCSFSNSLTPDILILGQSIFLLCLYLKFS